MITTWHLLMSRWSQADTDRANCSLTNSIRWCRNRQESDKLLLNTLRIPLVKFRSFNLTVVLSCLIHTPAFSSLFTLVQHSKLGLLLLPVWWGRSLVSHYPFVNRPFRHCSNKFLVLQDQSSLVQLLWLQNKCNEFYMLEVCVFNI